MYESNAEMKIKMLTQTSDLLLINRIRVHLKILKELSNIQLNDLPNNELAEHNLSFEKHLRGIELFIKLFSFKMY